MAIKFTNNAFGTLASSILSTDLAISLTAGQGARFPVLGATDWFYADLLDASGNLELVKVTARVTDALTVVRGQDGTTARAYTAGDRLELRLCSAALNDIINPIVQLVTGGSVTANAPLFDATQTWNNAGITFQGVRVNITDTASNAASLLADLQVAGASKFKVDKTGLVTALSATLTGVLALAGATVSGAPTWSSTQAMNISGSSASTTGNAATATALQTGRTINGVNFDGSANITVAAAAGTLTGGTLAAVVLASSLTSLGTLTSLTMGGNLTMGANTLALASATVSGAPTWSSTQAMSISGSAASATGNAGTATALQTSRTINGVGFDGTGNITVAAAAGTLTGNTLAAGVTASSLTSLGTLTSLAVTGAITTGGFTVGYLEAPFNQQDANYTLVLADSGKTVYHTSATPHTHTIPANASVAYPVGTILTFVNDTGAGNVSIAITTDTLRFIPGGTTGTRTLAANGRATAVKMTATTWQIAGTNLT